MARQNYQHGKRLREIAKKQKREEKLQRKLEKKTGPLEGSPENPPQETVIDPDLRP